MKFKVGDRVRIKKWENMLKYGKLDHDGDIILKNGNFRTIMKHLIGRTATISDISCNTIYLNKWSSIDGDISNWEFTEEVLEKADKTLYELEVGDIIVNKDGDEKMILGVHEGSNPLYHISSCGYFEGFAYNRTASELKTFEYKIKKDMEVVEEMTLEDAYNELVNINNKLEELLKSLKK